MRHKTKASYQAWLDTLRPDFESEEWIIGGKNRNKMFPHYGRALRTYDPIAFEVGFNEWEG